MILTPKQTTIAYRCPHCGCAVMSIVGSFATSAQLLRLKCPCGKSELTISRADSQKLRITLPCLFCNNDHSYVVSNSLFYGRDLFLLNCAYTNIDICFIGDREQVDEALKENEEILRQAFDDAGITSLDAAHPEKSDFIPDEQICDIINYMVSELEAEDAIECPCHNGDYGIEMNEEYIRIYCKNCGGQYVIPCTSLTAAHDFINCDRLVLTDPEEHFKS